MVFVTISALIVTYRTLGILKTQTNAAQQAAVAAKENAEAAKQSAETANTSLRLAHRPYFDLRKAAVHAETRKNDERPHLTVQYQVYNASHTPADVFKLNTEYLLIPGDDDRSMMSGGAEYQTTLTPGRGYDVPCTSADWAMRRTPRTRRTDCWFRWRAKSGSRIRSATNYIRR